MQQVRATTKSLTFAPLPEQLSQLGRQWRERKCPIFETVAKQDSNPGSLYSETGILLLSYRAYCVGILASILFPEWFDPKEAEVILATKLDTETTLHELFVHIWVINGKG